MPRYSYLAADRAGERIRGTRDASDVASVRASLKSDGLFVIEVSDALPAATTGDVAGRTPGRLHLVEATRAIAALLGAGLPLTRAIAATSRIVPAEMGGVLNAVRTDVERGLTLATALEAHRSTFPHHYVGLIRAGERSGDLTAAFARLADQLERDERLRARILSAALYPLILAVAGGGALVVLAVVVLPKFAELLADAGTTLPATTAAVLSVSRLLRDHGTGALVAVFALGIGGVAAARSTAGRVRVAHVIDRLPLIGGLVRELAAAKFARITGTLVMGGATLLSALDDAVSAVGSPLTAAAARRARAKVREGSALHLALRDEPVMPPMLSQLVQLGEDSGRLGEFLVRSADMFEERSERTLQRVITLAEPALIVVFGSVVGFVALSLLQAIYSVNAGSFR